MVQERGSHTSRSLFAVYAFLLTNITHSAPKRPRNFFPMLELCFAYHLNHRPDESETHLPLPYCTISGYVGCTVCDCGFGRFVTAIFFIFSDKCHNIFMFLLTASVVPDFKNSLIRLIQILSYLVSKLLLCDYFNYFSFDCLLS